MYEINRCGTRPAGGRSIVKDSACYVKIVEWSEEDQC